MDYPRTVDQDYLLCSWYYKPCIVCIIGILADVSLDCGNKKFHCPNEKASHTCQAPDTFLEWNLQNSSNLKDLFELGFAGRVDPVGSTSLATYRGILFTAELTSKINGSIVSNINYTIQRSLNNTRIGCEDGNTGAGRECNLRLFRT